MPTHTDIDSFNFYTGVAGIKCTSMREEAIIDLSWETLETRVIRCIKSIVPDTINLDTVCSEVVKELHYKVTDVVSYNIQEPVVHFIQIMDRSSTTVLHDE